MNSTLRSAAWLGSFAVLLGCQQLEHIRGGVCGNNVREAGEECDSSDPATCRACRFVCNLERPCPFAGAGCGTDGLCRVPSGYFDARPIESTSAAYDLDALDLTGDRRDDLL